MAAYITSSAVTANKVWDSKLHYQGVTQIYWMKHKLMGKDTVEGGDPNGDRPAKPIILKEEFGKERKGDRIRLIIGAPLTTAGVAEGNTRKNSVGTLTDRTLDIDVSTWWGGASINDIRISKVRGPWDIEAGMVRRLATWAARKMNTDIFYAFIYGMSKNHIDNGITTVLYTGSSGTAVAYMHPNWLYANGAPVGYSGDSEAGLNENHKMSPRVINFCVEYARSHNFIPCDGDGSWGMVMSEEQWTSLFEDPTFNGALMRAKPPGDNNPLWTGAKGKWNDVFIHTSNDVQSANGLWVTGHTDDVAVPAGIDMGTNANAKRAIFFGGNAMGAGISDTKYTTLNDDDHQRVDERGVELLYGFRRADWGGTVGTQNSLIVSTYAKSSYLAQ